MSRLIKILIASLILILIAFFAALNYLPSYVTKMAQNKESAMGYLTTSTVLTKESFFSGTFSVTFTKNLSTEENQAILELISPVLFPKNPTAQNVVITGKYSLGLSGITLTFDETELPQLLSLKKWTTSFSLFRNMNTHIESNELFLKDIAKDGSNINFILAPYTLHFKSNSFKGTFPSIVFTNYNNDLKIDEMSISGDGDLLPPYVSGSKGSTDSAIKALYIDDTLVAKDFKGKDKFTVKGEEFTQKSNFSLDVSSEIIPAMVRALFTSDAFISITGKDMVFALPSAILNLNSSKMANLPTVNDADYGKKEAQILLTKGITADFGTITISSTEGNKIVITSSVTFPPNENAPNIEMVDNEYILTNLQASIKIDMPVNIYEVANSIGFGSHFTVNDKTATLNMSIKNGNLYSNDKLLSPLVAPKQPAVMAPPVAE